MDYEITSWRIPNDMIRCLDGLDAMVALLARKGGNIYLYDSDFQKFRRLAKQNLPATATLDNITFRGIIVKNGGTKKGKRPAPKYNPDRIKLK